MFPSVSKILFVFDVFLFCQVLATIENEGNTDFQFFQQLLSFTLEWTCMSCRWLSIKTVIQFLKLVIVLYFANLP